MLSKFFGREEKRREERRINRKKWISRMFPSSWQDKEKLIKKKKLCQRIFPNLPNFWKKVFEEIKGNFLSGHFSSLIKKLGSTPRFFLKKISYHFYSLLYFFKLWSTLLMIYFKKTVIANEPNFLNFFDSLKWKMRNTITRLNIYFSYLLWYGKKLFSSFFFVEIIFIRN